jgi:hypothetical protein
MSDSEPKHGATRHHGYKTIDGKPVEMLDARTGQVVYSGPSSSTTVSVSETYCGHCKAWIQTNGVLGPLKFMAEHRDGDCQKVKA